MPFWSSKPKVPLIPEVLRKGGKASEFGGPAAVVQYRVHAKTMNGNTVTSVDTEFQGALIAWRRFQADLDYYVDIGLPVGVVWDSRNGEYREVDLDTMMPWIKLENTDIWEETARRRAEVAERVKQEWLQKRRELAIAQSGQDLGADLPKFAGVVQGSEKAMKPKKPAAPRRKKANPGDDPTENIRRREFQQLNSEVQTKSDYLERLRLQDKYGMVWNQDEALQQFEFIGFWAPYLVVKDKLSGLNGVLRFQDRPRFYFDLRLRE